MLVLLHAYFSVNINTVITQFLRCSENCKSEETVIFFHFRNFLGVISVITQQRIILWGENTNNFDIRFMYIFTFLTIVIYTLDIQLCHASIFCSICRFRHIIINSCKYSVLQFLLLRNSKNCFLQSSPGYSKIYSNSMLHFRVYITQLLGIAS